MKIHRLQSFESSEHGATKVHVTGHLEINHGKETVIIPVSYKLDIDDDPEKHDRILREHEAKGKAFAERRMDFHPWVNVTEDVEDSKLKITDCALQYHGPNDFKVFVAWEETHADGRTERVHKTWNHHTPHQAISLEEVQAHVRGQVANRARVKAKAKDHKGALHAIHLAHAAEASGVRVPGGQGSNDPHPGGGGPPVKPGDK